MSQSLNRTAIKGEVGRRSGCVALDREERGKGTFAVP